ncbi:N-acetyltransferase [Bacillus sp. EB600]|uniref:GNAT family N-acetyltransferase n=1 Tax=Bacillus sp. EB600 TaxID=2806345 RepID=UPI00210DACA6|nr:GNAT family N-acetyltransferase [Bacillus sp. EB600]MCQ6279393.1 GNAT family N-acetyltransferase [Bacillus sp. EB600]
MRNVEGAIVFDKDSFQENDTNKGNGIDIEIIEGNLKDLNKVYAMLKEDFAAGELKDYAQLEMLIMKKNYKLLLAKHQIFDGIIGYAFIYQIDHLNAIWLDYIAIVKRFRNSGYGTLLFTKIAESYQRDISGIFIEVEIPEERAGLEPDNQKRRINFYERLGAKKLAIQYELPTNEGGFPMYLYYKPSRNSELLKKSQLAEAISSTFNYIHSDVKNREIILIKAVTSIGDHILDDMN